MSQFIFSFQIDIRFPNLASTFPNLLTQLIHMNLFIFIH